MFVGTDVIEFINKIINQLKLEEDNIMIGLGKWQAEINNIIFKGLNTFENQIVGSIEKVNGLGEVSIFGGKNLRTATLSGFFPNKKYELENIKPKNKRSKENGNHKTQFQWYQLGNRIR